MNVGNMITALGGQGSVVTVGTSAPETVGSLSNLFALQLGNAFAGMAPDEGVQQLQDSTSSEDLAGLGELLAMIQQMLSGNGLQQTQVTAFTDKLDALEHLSGNLMQSNTIAVPQADTQRLITTFTQQGLSQTDANRMIHLLAAIADSGQTEKQPEAKQLVQQVNQLLEQLGIKEKGDGKFSVSDSKDVLPAKGMVKHGAGFHSMLASKSFSQEADNQVQPLRMNVALAKYQAEAGVSGLNPGKAAESNALAKQTVLSETTGADSVPTTLFSIPVGQNSQITQPAQLQTGTQSHLVRADQFVQEMTEVFVKQMKLTEANGISEAKLILHPQSLGQVDVKITSQNGIITAHFTADSANGKELLDNQLPQLRAALVQQGLQVDRLEVSQQSQQPQLAYQQQREQARQQHGGNQPQKQQAKEEQPEFSIESLVDRAEPLATVISRLRMRGNVEYSA